MKKMLIVEEPDSCETCPLRSYSNLMLVCTPMREAASDVECPLKPMPEKKETTDFFEMKTLLDLYVTAWHYGWNACIDEILGEEE